MSVNINRRSLLAGIASSLGAPAFASNGKSLVMGIVPQFLPSVIFERWRPLLNEVAKQADVSIDIKHFETIPKFETAFSQGEFDLVYLNPYHAVMANKTQGYRPMVRDRIDLAGILVVHADSKINELSALDGGKLAFPAPNAFGASLYMRALLTRKYKLKFTAQYSQTHTNVYRQVVNGSALAGGGILSTLHLQPENIQKQLRIVFRTPSAASHPIAVHPRVSAQLHAQLEKGFLALNKDAQTRALLTAPGFSTLIKTAYAEYRPLEELELEKFVVASMNSEITRQQ